MKHVELMSNAEIKTELANLGDKWDDFRKDCEGGGSPGEWMYERMDELATEQKRRKKK